MSNKNLSNAWAQQENLRLVDMAVNAKRGKDYLKGDLKVIPGRTPDKPVINFCVGNNMSTCDVGGNWKQQIDCHFYEKAPFAKRCNHFKFDEYCGCLKAQMANGNPSIVKMKEEVVYGPHQLTKINL